VVTVRGVRATATLEYICCKKIRGCSYRASGASFMSGPMRGPAPVRRRWAGFKAMLHLLSFCNQCVMRS
jgi:hypothetical protein